MIDTTALTDTQQQFVAKHYPDALRIGNSYKSSVLHDDEKETIAVRNLIRAAKTFDATRLGFNGRPALFSTYLYWCILTSLMSADKGVLDKDTKQYRPKKSRIPRNKLLSESIYVRVQENWRDSDYSEFASLFPVYDNFNDIEFSDLLASIRARLDERQQFLFNALLDPIGMGIPITSSNLPAKVTIQSLADISGVSKQRVSKEIIKLRELVHRMIRCQDSAFFRINPKEKHNG